MALISTLKGRTLKGRTLILGARAGGLEPAVLPIKAGGAALNINATLGTASASGFAANIDKQLGISATIGVATASGYAAQVDRQYAVAGTIGTATASGLLANVDRQYGIAATLSTSIAYGFTANVDSQVSFTATAATAAAGGFAVAVDFAQTITATIGTAVTDGYAATIDFPAGGVTIDCTAGVATASGFAANVDQQLGVSVGTATAQGFISQVDQQYAVSAGIGIVLADGFISTITFPSIVAGRNNRRKSQRKILVTIRGARFLVPEDHLHEWLEARTEIIVAQEAIKPTKNGKRGKPIAIKPPVINTESADSSISELIEQTNRIIRERIIQQYWIQHDNALALLLAA